MVKPDEPAHVTEATHYLYYGKEAVRGSDGVSDEEFGRNGYGAWRWHNKIMVYGLPGELSQEGRAASRFRTLYSSIQIPKSRVAYDRDCEQLWDVETRFTRITKVGLARAAVKFLEMRMEHQTDSGSVFEAGLEQGLYDSLSKLKLILRTHKEHWNDACHVIVECRLRKDNTTMLALVGRTAHAVMSG
ncbi:hypothetical protein B0H14DRAFT_2622828 [Mycena olivaceomarginata]|nr:hypothetical protein B0H14DRAFT_2622828 [Mycena olivaceomarginata]